MGAARPRTFYLEIAAVSFAVLCLEVSYTRIFSFKLYYYFTYLIIGIALLGLGAGGVLLTVVARLRATPPERLIPGCCVVGSAAAALGYLVVAGTEIAAFELGKRPGEVAKLLLVCVSLFAPFLMAGVVIAAVFAARSEKIGRLYCADLLGAGLACVLWVPVAERLTPPGCVFLASLVLVLGALPLIVMHARRWLLPGAAVVAGLAVMISSPAALPDPMPDPAKPVSVRNARYLPVLFTRWSPLFRIDVTEPPFPHYGSLYRILHDGLLGSIVYKFSGDLSALPRFDTNTRSHPFRAVRDAPAVLIIGAAGGHEVLASLYFGARHVTAVELNPVTVSLLTTHFADYSGRLAEHDRVTLVNAEGRSFLKGQGGRYDLIWFVAPDSYAAMNAATAGAYVLSESYLYTVEMILETLGHLTPGGIICAQFGEVDYERKPNRAARYVATAREAFRRFGIDDFERHILVVTEREFFTQVTILLKPAPFSKGEVERFAAGIGLLPNSVLRHAWGRAVDEGPVGKSISLPQARLARWHRAHPYDLQAVTDDSPFFWHFTRFRDVLRPGASGWEEQTGERVLLILLGFVVVFAGVFLLLPLAITRGAWQAVPHKTSAAVYFAAIGLGFMFFEIALIQKLVLLLGYPTYSLTVTLFALLFFTGVGSPLSARYLRRRDRSLAVLFVSLAVVTFGYQVGIPVLVDRFVGAALAARVGLAVLLLAPLGVCLGAFMPLGLRTVAGLTTHKREFVAWSWAVNGFFSVIGSILSTILAMVLGFTTLLWCAVAVYLVGICALLRVPSPGEGARST